MAKEWRCPAAGEGKGALIKGLGGSVYMVEIGGK
jgi:hypothetical protein